jgi:hypothetical protein
MKRVRPNVAAEPTIPLPLRPARRARTIVPAEAATPAVITDVIIVPPRVQAVGKIAMIAAPSLLAPLSLTILGGSHLIFNKKVLRVIATDAPKAATTTHRVLAAIVTVRHDQPAAKAAPTLLHARVQNVLAATIRSPHLPPITIPASIPSATMAPGVISAISSRLRSKSSRRPIS